MTKWEYAFHATGAGRVNYLTTPHALLTKAFGDDGTVSSRDEYKSMCEWHVETPAGMVEVYDYKLGTCYSRTDGLPREQITEWHVQGKPVAIELMLVVLDEAVAAQLAQPVELVDVSQPTRPTLAELAQQMLDTDTEGDIKIPPGVRKALVELAGMKVPADWERETGTRIINPDGWLMDGQPWDAPITRADFEERATHSTIERPAWTAPKDDVQ